MRRPPNMNIIAALAMAGLGPSLVIVDDLAEHDLERERLRYKPEPRHRVIQLTGAVEHVATEKPLSKRARRRLRGKSL